MKTPDSPTPNLVRRIDLSTAGPEDVTRLLRTQWLVSNGLGGYASSSISGAISWRYHGLLIAALPAPLGRILMLNHLAESLVRPDGRVIEFGGSDPGQPQKTSFANFLVEFRLENHLPFWRYDINGIVIEKRVLMLNLQNRSEERR